MIKIRIEELADIVIDSINENTPTVFSYFLYFQKNKKKQKQLKTLFTFIKNHRDDLWAWTFFHEEREKLFEEVRRLRVNRLTKVFKANVDVDKEIWVVIGAIINFIKEMRDEADTILERIEKEEEGV